MWPWAHVEIKHLLTAVIMTAPATIMLAKIFIPETGKPATAGKVEIHVEDSAVNVIDAAAQGAGDGLQLCLNIAGMLIAFLALIAMVNGILAWGHHYVGWLPTSLESICGAIFAPVAWILGVPWQDAPTMGGLLGTRLITNEIRGFSATGADEGPFDAAIFYDRDVMRCVGLRISVLSRYRLAGLGRLRRAGNRIWRDWDYGRWRRGRWRTLCRLALRECFFDGGGAAKKPPERRLQPGLAAPQRSVLTRGDVAGWGRADCQSAAGCQPGCQPAPQRTIEIG